jgi:hypothetical protein
MEKVITRRMLCYLYKHCLITKEQYGFLSGKSTTLNLLDALNDWTQAINNRHSVAVAYIDYAKAFDTVNSVKLCRQVEGIRNCRQPLTVDKRLPHRKDPANQSR